MINLYINYFAHPNEQRKIELDFCLKQNVKNELIDRIIVLAEDYLPVEHNKIVFIPVNKRPTYQDFFDLTKDYSTEDINIISNSDIAFNETVEAFKNLDHRKAYAITRSEYIDGVIKDFFSVNKCPAHFSQDVWAFKGHVKLKNCEKVLAMNLTTKAYELIPFTMGVPGCDNVIAHYIGNQYLLRNPNGIIRCLHVHEEQGRPQYTHRMTGNKSRWGKLTKVMPSKL